MTLFLSLLAPLAPVSSDRWAWHGGQALQLIVGSLFIHFGKNHSNKSTLFGGFCSQSSFLESKRCQTSFAFLSDVKKACIDKETGLDEISQAVGRLSILHGD